MTNPFYFYTRFHQIKLLGRKAKNLVELLDEIKTIPGSSIYYHTHRFLQQHHYLSPEPPNDFAYWVTNILGLKELGEMLASVDIITFRYIRDLRIEFVRLLTDYISKEKHIVNCPEGHEFQFMSCASFILPTPYVANNLVEFIEILRKITIDSLYFHMFEARIRLEKGENDFSAWFREMGMDTLAEKLSKLDPYTMTLEGLKQKIIDIVGKYVKD
ncbi:MAG: DUF5752 family protein [Elusimicrobiota bacterium]|nr:DUF5752 family protein [Elusimicrobiota bacterium]